MRAYECIYILNPSLDEQAVKDKAVKYSEIITARQGQISKVDQWGKRRLAYPIDKIFEGYYTFIRFTGGGEILKELDRVFRFDETVLRHSIVVEEKPNPAEHAKAPAEGK
ncbi:MAG: 30S ribosomal protein S6 [Candidatus Krumholzibacteria bacterium]|nr:30S ribosomal protein S6 [Candidatus Krumholzibacteria bacterium]